MSAPIGEAEAASRLQAGEAALAAGRAPEAEQIARAVLAARRRDAGAHYLLGRALAALGRFADAETAFRALDRLRPGVAEVATQLALCALQAGDGARAVRLLRAAARKHPGDFNIAYNLAGLLHDEGELDAAIEAYERALAIDPAHLFARRGLAFTLSERGNDVRAGEIADGVLGDAPHDPVAIAVRAACALRAGKPDEARALVERHFRREASDPVNTALVLGRYGEALDRLGEPQRAFAAWQAGNGEMRAAFAARHEASAGAYSLAEAQRLRSVFAGRPGGAAAEPRGPAPVFLVGFQRAGTTLIEQILAAHPAVQTTGEDDSIAPLREAAGSGEDSLRALLAADPARLTGLRRKYWKAARPEGPPGDGRVFIDKLPLNMIWLGVIGRVFPDARILLAVRDPRDVVLSAFQQRFAMTDANYRLLDWQETARFYDAVMGAGMAGLAASPGPEVYEARYEAIVADWRGEARRMLDFLGLPWDEAVLDYREQAKARAITTPSADQVRRPVYTDALGRWKRYEFAYGPVMVDLAAWVERFGY
ncbi:sulfotransferase family protein [Marinicauda algicola]|uniref:Sulfotransferase family protein n=1 Tax=Marinicauda algicola TaxID=2029849 RepID=A0A4S2H0N5_9PROT|nr:sulfotransferase [Marinicauda algicola]TGY88953.1 sulfotransferase family protein [Marinicauda algicola]